MFDKYEIDGVVLEIGQTHAFIYYRRTGKTFVVSTDKGRDALERLSMYMISGVDWNLEFYFSTLEATLEVA